MPTVTSTVVDTLRAGRERRAAENAASEAAASAQAAAAALAALQPVVTPAPVVVPAADAAASGEAKSAAKPTGDFKYKAIGVQEEYGVIIGIGAAADNVDLDLEIVNKGALIQMSYDFCASTSRTFKANHTAIISCELVASWPGDPILKSGKALKKGDPIPEDDEIIGIGIGPDSGSSWFVGVKPQDKAILDAAKKGEIAGFSWSGFCCKKPIEAKE